MFREAGVPSLLATQGAGPGAGGRLTMGRRRESAGAERRERAWTSGAARRTPTTVSAAWRSWSASTACPRIRS